MGQSFRTRITIFSFKSSNIRKYDIRNGPRFKDFGVSGNVKKQTKKNGI